MADKIFLRELDIKEYGSSTAQTVGFEVDVDHVFGEINGQEVPLSTIIDEKILKHIESTPESGVHGIYWDYSKDSLMIGDSEVLRLTRARIELNTSTFTSTDRIDLYYNGVLVSSKYFKNNKIYFSVDKAGEYEIQCSTRREKTKVNITESNIIKKENISALLNKCTGTLKIGTSETSNKKNNYYTIVKLGTTKIADRTGYSYTLNNKSYWDLNVDNYIGKSLDIYLYETEESSENENNYLSHQTINLTYDEYQGKSNYIYTAILSEQKAGILIYFTDSLDIEKPSSVKCTYRSITIDEDEEVQYGNPIEYNFTLANDEDDIDNANFIYDPGEYVIKVDFKINTSITNIPYYQKTFIIESSDLVTIDDTYEYKKFAINRFYNKLPIRLEPGYGSKVCWYQDGQSSNADAYRELGLSGTSQEIDIYLLYANQNYDVVIKNYSNEVLKTVTDITSSNTFGESLNSISFTSNRICSFASSSWSDINTMANSYYLNNDLSDEEIQSLNDLKYSPRTIELSEVKDSENKIIIPAQTIQLKAYNSISDTNTTFSFTNSVDSTSTTVTPMLCIMPTTPLVLAQNWGSYSIDHFFTQYVTPSAVSSSSGTPNVSSSYTFNTTNLETAINTHIYNALPSDLKNIIKSVQKKQLIIYREGSLGKSKSERTYPYPVKSTYTQNMGENKIFLPSMDEIDIQNKPNIGISYNIDLQDRTLLNSDNIIKYLTRDIMVASSVTSFDMSLYKNRPSENIIIKDASNNIINISNKVFSCDKDGDYSFGIPPYYTNVDIVPIFYI